MNLLQDNPVGKALVFTTGALLLVAVAITIVWSLPVKVDEGELAAGETAPRDTVSIAQEIASLNELQVINQRPVFNEDRLPVIDAVDDDDGAAAAADPAIQVMDAPDVKLTGVIITPEVKIATLTPASGSAENVMAREGESLIGEYLGWKVAEVKPRTVLLRSSDGQRMELDLQIHDQLIREPPKTAATSTLAQQAVAQAAKDQAALAQDSDAQDAGTPTGEDGQPLSRAEQIRQRIADRREQLRLEQEARVEQLEKEQGPSGRQNYQNAIRGLINGRKNQERKDRNDG